MKPTLKGEIPVGDEQLPTPTEERELRLTLDDLSNALENADLIDGGETVSEVRIELGELIITVIQ